MGMYTIQDENNEVYADMVFTSMGHASEVADMLIQTWGKYYWVTPMRSIEYDSQVEAIRQGITLVQQAQQAIEWVWHGICCG